MPIITGFDELASVAEEQITDKIGRRVISGKQGTMVYWRMKAGRARRWSPASAGAVCLGDQGHNQITDWR